MNFKLLKPINIAETDEIKKLEDEMVTSVKSDKDIIDCLKRIGIDSEDLIRRNISNITAFKDDVDYCKACPGFLLCNKTHPHYIFYLKKRGNFLDKALMPCKLKSDDNKLNEKYLIRDFPDEWRELTISDLRRSGKRMALIKRYKDAKYSEKNWIFIQGDHRSGKSIFAATIVNDLMSTNGGKCAFLNYPRRVRQLQDYTYSNREDFDALMKIYCSVDYLVIDDFGNEYKSDYVRDSITLSILNERARRKLITIFTSVFNFDEIASMYMLKKADEVRANQLINLLNVYAIQPYDITSPVGTYKNS